MKKPVNSPQASKEKTYHVHILLESHAALSKNIIYDNASASAFFSICEREINEEKDLYNGVETLTKQSQTHGMSNTPRRLWTWINPDSTDLCCLLLYGRPNGSTYINRIILEATISFIKSFKRFV